MNKKLAVFASLLVGGAAIALGVARNDATSETEPEIPPAAVAEATPDAAVPPAFEPAAADLGDAAERQADALARLDAERLRLADALTAAEAEAARLAVALAEAERVAAEPEPEPGPGREDAQAEDAATYALVAGLAERDAELLRLAETLAARDDELARLSADLAVQSAEIGRLSEAMAARDAELARLLDEAKIAAATQQPVAAPPSSAPAAANVSSSAAELTADPAAAIDPAKAASVPAPLADGPVGEVHFDMGSAILSPGGAMRAAETAAALIAMDAAAVRVTGHSDTVGSASANLALSRARARSVADALVAAGLPRARIEVTGLGQDADALPVRTAAGVPEPLNRSVGIWAAGPRLAMN